MMGKRIITKSERLCRFTSSPGGVSRPQGPPQSFPRPSQRQQQSLRLRIAQLRY